MIANANLTKRFCSVERIVASLLSNSSEVEHRERIWFLRISHTRLADIILELCAVPAKDALRRTCLRILTQFSAPPPGALTSSSDEAQNKRSNKSNERKQRVIHDLQVTLDRAVANDGLPRAAADRLRLFLSSECLPLSPNVNEAIMSVGKSLNVLRAKERQNNMEARRVKRYEDAARSLLSLKYLVQTMESIGIGPVFESMKGDAGPNVVRPLYVSLDLGFRQKRKHFHGQLVFQCIVLPSDFLKPGGGDEKDKLLTAAAVGSKIAEGGRYDELVSVSHYVLFLSSKLC